MIESVQSNGINTIQQLRASQAFKAAKSQLSQPEILAEEETTVQNKDSNVFFDVLSPKEKQILTKESFEEIKNVAQSITTNISEDDIKYGLKYGRSVLVDVSA